MNRQIFAWDSFQNQLRQEDRLVEFFCTFGLFLAALVIYGINLGNLPLRDWDEATIAQVAKEISQSSFHSWHWLFPTLWGEAYLNKPPLIHNLIALLYRFIGVNEWTTRLPSAFLTAVSVPLLYNIGREIFVVRNPALYSALIYLTLLPVVRHGRLAMLDGPILCFELLMILSILRTRRDLRWSLGAGISLGLICLTKGAIAILIGSIALLFLAWDTPRLLNSFYLWLGLFLGILPAIAWYGAQIIHYQQLFINTAIVNQSFQRIWDAVEGHSAPPWYYFLELFKYSWPWLLPISYGLKLAIENRNWGWAKLVLVWSTSYFVCVSLMTTKLPWYILPIYPVLALAGGARLAALCNLPSKIPYPLSWRIFLLLLSIVASVGCAYFGVVQGDISLTIILACIAFTMAVSAFLLQHRDRQFISLLFWGMYVSLLLFVCSPHWIWELNEAYKVKPVANLIQRKVPSHQAIYTNFAYERPSLNFYSERQIIPHNEEELKEVWQKENRAYFLLDSSTWEKLKLPLAETLGTINDSSEKLVLIAKKPKGK